MTRPTIASLQSALTEAGEKLREANEKAMLHALSRRRLAADLRHCASERRWGAIVLLLFMVKEISEPARYILSYGNSWAWKVAVVYYTPYFLFSWLTLSALLLIPHIVLLAWKPDHELRRRTSCLAAWGLGLGMVAYASMAFLAKQGFDAPQAVDSWACSAIVCLIVMLRLGASVNSASNRKREAAREGTCADSVS